MASRMLPSVREVAIARRSLEQDLDETTLLPIFLGRVPARMQAAIDMITSGRIKSEHFFHDHISRVMIDPTTREQMPETVSLLDDLIDLNKSSLPNLSSFAESQFVVSRQPEEQLLDNFQVIASLLSACRGEGADPRIRRAAGDPELIARMWSAFAERLAALHLKKCSTLVGTFLLRGLDELEILQPSRARAVTASQFACLVHMLDTSEQFVAFKRTVRIVLTTTSNTELICNAASSLVHLAPRWIPRGAGFLMNNARTDGAFYDLPKAIGTSFGKTGRDIEKWFDRGCLNIELRRLLQATTASGQQN
jgi:hypothetical protein